MSLTHDVLEQLRAPFPEDKILVKVQSVDRERGRAMLVRYLQHTDVADRLDEVDPSWSSKIHRVDPDGKLFFVHMELTIAGVARDNVGEGKDPKSAASDALKRCAMLFGVGRALYDKGRAWISYNEDQDRYRRWTIDDYHAALGEPVTPASGREPPVKPKVGKNGPARTKKDVITEIDDLQKQLNLSDRDLIKWGRDCAGVSPDRMDVYQLENFALELQTEKRKAGKRS